jgi:predicted Zn-dependent peptidase
VIEGNPPIPIPLFAVPISEETFKYICIKKGNLEEASEEIKKEFVQVKEKLSKAAAEFERAINKLIDSTLHL